MLESKDNLGQKWDENITKAKKSADVAEVVELPA
jgi:hypothetical protein